MVNSSYLIIIILIVLLLAIVIIAEGNGGSVLDCWCLSTNCLLWLANSANYGKVLMVHKC